MVAVLMTALVLAVTGCKKNEKKSKVDAVSAIKERGTFYIWRYKRGFI